MPCPRCGSSGADIEEEIPVGSNRGRCLRCGYRGPLDELRRAPTPALPTEETAKAAFMRDDRVTSGRILMQLGYRADQIDELFGRWAREKAEAEAAPAPPIEEAEEPERLTREDYLREINRLREMYRRGEVSEEYLRRQMHTLMERHHGRRVAEKARSAAAEMVAKKRFKPGAWLYATAKGVGLGKILPLILFFVAGVIIGASFNSLWFIFAFFSLGLVFVLPGPEDFKPAMPGPLGWGQLNPWGAGGRHAGFGFVRSFLKMTAIFCFAMAFQSTAFPFFKVATILTLFVGYFLLKGTYNPEAPSELIESIFRLALGLMIPIWVFGVILPSLPMFFVALAFFFVPPTPSSRSPEMMSPGMSQMYAYWAMIDKFAFLFIMLFAVGGVVFFRWELTGTLAWVFWYFWFICLVAGLFSPAETRPYTGTLMIGAMVVIFGIGPGSQEMGKMLLGVWWPAVHNTAMSFIKPFGQMFEQLSQTFGSMLFMLTNPVGYAEQIMAGTYEPSPIGPTGAYGVELERFTVQPIYAGQPFAITLNANNKGVFDAEDVKVGIIAHPKSTGNELKKVLKDLKTGEPEPEGFKLHENLEELGNGKNPYVVDKIEGEPINMKIKYILPFLFVGNINCEGAKKYEQDYIPITGVISYEYETNSWLSVEFVSTDEWKRRSEEEGFAPVPVRSHLSTAPVALHIGTMDQPIVAGWPFYIGFNLTSEKGKNSEIIAESADVTIGSFDDFGSARCIPKPPDEIEDGMYKWIELPPGEAVTCYFAKAPEITERSKTYIITANATYEFMIWETIDTLFSFKDVCP